MFLNPKQLNRSVLCLLALCCLIISGCVAEQSKPGLYVENGTLMRKGSEFRAMGINYNSAFYDVLKDPETLEVAEGFRILKQDYGIPFIRFSAGPYAHTQWKLYVEEPEEYLRRFDVLVKHAEAQGVGLIPSFFWAYSPCLIYRGSRSVRWATRTVSAERLCVNTFVMWLGVIKIHLRFGAGNSAMNIY